MAEDGGAVIEDQWASATADLLDLIEAVLNEDDAEYLALAQALAAEYGSLADDPDVSEKRRVK